MQGRQKMDRRHILIGLTASLGVLAWPALAETWVNLGTREVRLRRDRDRFVVGEARGRFSRLRIEVAGNDVFVVRVAAVMGNGDVLSFPVGTTVAQGTASRPLDLPGEVRLIRHVDVIYRRVPGGGLAAVTLYGMKG